MFGMTNHRGTLSVYVIFFFSFFFFLGGGGERLGLRLEERYYLFLGRGTGEALG